MPLDKTARAFVPRVEQLKEHPVLPHEIVQCECPAPCYVAKSTIASLKATGMPYKFHCSKCCPDEFRQTVQAVADAARDDPLRDRTQPVSGIFSSELGVIIEGATPADIPAIVAMARGEMHPREKEPVTVTLTLDVGEWVDILTSVGQTAEWMETRRKPGEPGHPRGERYLTELHDKVKRMVMYEVDRQVIKKKP